MIKKILIFIMLFIPFNVFAACSSNELSRYKSLYGNIGNYYDYNGSTFDVTLYNVPSYFRVVDKNNNKEYLPNSSDVVIPGFSSGSVVKLAIYPTSGECYSYRVGTVYINLPYFNSYYTDPVCVNNDNVLCSKWANTSMYNHDEFVSIVKKETVVTPDTPTVIEDTSKYGFFDFLGDYYIFILLFIIFGGSAWIYYLKKKDSFDF